MNKETIKQIKELKKQGKKIVEISKELGIAYSIVSYHYSEDYKKKHIARVISCEKKKPSKRDKVNYQNYQRNYRKKRYAEDEEFRERIKKISRDTQKIYYHKKKEENK